MQKYESSIQNKTDIKKFEDLVTRVTTIENLIGVEEIINSIPSKSF